MAPTIQQKNERAKLLEKQLAALVEQGPAPQLPELLQAYRLACEDVILSDFEYAQAQNVENRLWEMHTKLHSVYKDGLRRLRRDGKLVVETRKMAKQYMGFIKASQRFYRQHIRRLDAQAGGIHELRNIAQRIPDDVPALSSHARFPEYLQPQVVKVCHTTLIKLGDLSRYRETELCENVKERNWGPAKGYYNLAAEVDPDSGITHHQLAVIAQEDADHFRCVYHLYRSLACKRPHPLARQNLVREFKKIVTAFKEPISASSPANCNAGTRALVTWFVRLHGKCFKGEEFAQYDELENEVLTQLTNELKERALDSYLQKMILINLAAEYYSTVQINQSEGPPKNTDRQSYFYFLRLNVKTFFTLLQIFQAELERLSEGDDVTRNGDQTSQLSDKITAVTRRVLPGLRLYSNWFFRFWQILNANIADTLTTVEIQELWKAYAGTLTLIASSFPANQLPDDDYMLEEDVETIGFQPLDTPETRKLWYHGTTLKKKCTDMERSHPNIEMLMRVRDFLVHGLQLTQREDAPLDLDGLRFIYREAGLPSELLASPNNRPAGSPGIPADVITTPLFPQEIPIAEDQKSHSAAPPSETTSTHIARDCAMNQMVDDLVGAEDGLEPLAEMDEPPTPPEQVTFDDAMVAGVQNGVGSISISDLVSSVQNYKKTTGSPAPITPLLSVPMDRATSSSSIRQPAALPSLPDGQYNSPSIWNPSYSGTPNPSSPLPIHAHAQDRRGSGLYTAQLSGSYGHVRGDSSASLRSSDWAFTAGPSAYTRPVPGPAGLGNGAAWGNPAAVGYNSAYANNGAYSVYGNNAHYNHSNVADVNLASPLLFGKSSWKSDYDRTQTPYNRTPPNGQGG